MKQELCGDGCRSVRTTGRGADDLRNSCQTVRTAYWSADGQRSARRTGSTASCEECVLYSTRF